MADVVSDYRALLLRQRSALGPALHKSLSDPLLGVLDRVAAQRARYPNMQLFNKLLFAARATAYGERKLGAELEGIRVLATRDMPAASRDGVGAIAAAGRALPAPTAANRAAIAEVRGAHARLTEWATDLRSLGDQLAQPIAEVEQLFRDVQTIQLGGGGGSKPKPTPTPTPTPAPKPPGTPPKPTPTPTPPKPVDLRNHVSIGTGLRRCALGYCATLNNSHPTLAAMVTVRKIDDNPARVSVPQYDDYLLRPGEKNKDIGCNYPDGPHQRFNFTIHKVVAALP